MCSVSAPSRSEAPGPTDVVLVLPAALTDAAGGRHLLLLRPGKEPRPGHGAEPGPAVADVLALLQMDFPGVYRRLCDETGDVRRHVNLYVNGRDIRDLAGASTILPGGAELLVLQSIAGG